VANEIELLIKGSQTATQEIDKASASLNKFERRFVAASAGVAAAGVAVVATLSKISDATAKWGDQMAKTATRLNLAVGDVDALRFAADRSGASFESLVMGLRSLSRRSAEAARGNKTYSDTFQRLGIEIKKADGSMRPVKDLLLDIADASSRAEDNSALLADLMNIMGDAFLPLVPLLKEGSDGIKILTDEALHPLES